MKKILLIISLCFISILAISQNYEPFLLGKTYRYLNPKDSTLILQKIDSVSVNVEGDSVFKSVRGELICPIEDYVSKSSIYIYAESYTKNRSSYIFKYRGYNVNVVDREQKFNLIINATENQIWRTDSNATNYIKYIGKQKKDFLGLTDSVKVYYLMKDSLSVNLLDTFYLSKNYGFINAFENYSLYSITELGLGLKSEINYNASIGDTLVYGILPDCPGQRILELVKSPKIYYWYDRLNKRSQFYENIEKGEFYLNLNCTSVAGFDNHVYKQNAGLYYEQSWAESESGMAACLPYTQLLYQKSKNYEFGDRKELDKIMSVDDKGINTSVEIYPNPSNGVVNIDLQNQEVSQVSVLDSKGVEVYYSEILNSNIILKLNAGLYLVKVVSKNQVAVNKLVVE